MKILTLVIPCFNVEEYLEKTIESILLSNERTSIDVVIVNDGSTDNTKNIATKYADRFNDCLSVINKENGGHGSTINAGLKIAKGKYFAVVDGDDWVDSKILDKLIEFLKNSNADVIITGHYKNFITDGHEEKYSYSEPRGYFTGVKYLVEHNMRIPMTDLCYKTDLLRKVNLTIQENTFYVDEEYCSFPFERAQTIHFFSEGFYHYRIGDENQSISSTNMVKRVDHKIRVFYRIMRNINPSNMDYWNYEYVLRKMAGCANSILLIYFIYSPDQKRGRKAAKQFWNCLITEFPDLVNKCKKQYYAFEFLSYLHIGPEGWNRYQRIKYKIKEC